MSDAATLPPFRAALVRVAAALGSRDSERIEQALTRAVAEAEPAMVEEVLLQSHLFVGFPDALEAMVRWRRLSDATVVAPYPEDPDLWRSRGEAVCATVYGANYAKLRQNVTLLHPDLDRWMVEGGYGRVIARPGLDLATRELCIAALLAVWNAPRQLHSHLRGALNVGADRREIECMLAIAAEYLDEAAAVEVHELWFTITGSGRAQADETLARPA